MKHINLGDAIVLLEDVRAIRIIKNGSKLEVTYTDNSSYVFDIPGFDPKDLVNSIWGIITGDTDQEW